MKIYIVRWRVAPVHPARSLTRVLHISLLLLKRGNESNGDAGLINPPSPDPRKMPDTSQNDPEYTRAEFVIRLPLFSLMIDTISAFRIISLPVTSPVY